LRHPVPPNRRFPPLWLPGMLVSEFAPWYFVGRALVAALLIALGALELAVGRAGLALFALSELGLLVLMRRSWISARNLGYKPRPGDLFNVWLTLPAGVEVDEGVPYADGLTLDVYRKPGLEGAPALIYLHPGSWMRGGPGRQARPLLYGLAEAGWVVLDIQYPLSPRATFPDHLVGVKTAIVWVKTVGRRYGVDPHRVAVAGGSSGAHLASLAALTSNMPELSASVTGADSSVIACAAHYGIYDLLVRNATRYDWPFVSRHVMKAKPDESPDLYRLASPIDLAHPDSPPFLVVHGELDSVVLAAESTHFVEALESAGVETEYVEVKGGQHGFDAFPTLRARAIGRYVADFLTARAAANRQIDGNAGQGSSLQ
jgi:acetyl esterase/lipase